MAIEKVKILGLDIGYVATVNDTCDGSKPQAKLDMEPLALPVAYWQRSRVVSLNVDEKDDWVADYLQTEINRVVPPSERVVIAKEDLLTLLPMSRSQPISGSAVFGKATGTRCKLVGPEWRNSRSYLVRPASGKGRWPTKGVKNVAYFATLTWLCWPKAAALLNKPSRAPQQRKRAKK